MVLHVQTDYVKKSVVQKAKYEYCVRIQKGEIIFYYKKYFFNFLQICAHVFKKLISFIDIFT